MPFATNKEMTNQIKQKQNPKTKAKAKAKAKTEGSRLSPHATSVNQPSENDASSLFWHRRFPSDVQQIARKVKCHTGFHKDHQTSKGGLGAKDRSRHLGHHTCCSKNHDECSRRHPQGRCLEGHRPSKVQDIARLPIRT